MSSLLCSAYYIEFHRSLTTVSVFRDEPPALQQGGDDLLDPLRLSWLMFSESSVVKQKRFIRMSSRRIPITRIFLRLLASCALLILALPVRAQRPTGGAPTQGVGQRSAGPSLPIANEIPVDVLVSVREPSGMPLAGNALVKLYSDWGVHLTVPTQDNSTATFPRIFAGEYEIEVTALGYKTTTEHASIFPGGSSYTVYVYLHSENEVLPGGAAPSGAIITPRLQSEIDKGLEKMRKHQYDAARAQFEKAAKLAPGNPDIQYLLGMLEYTQEHFDAARAKFQAALAIYPSHERSLLSLGELQLRTGDAAEAAQTLEKAYKLNGADWRTHLLLANAYVQQKNYEKALPHATRAAELGRDHAGPAWMLLGQILMQQEKREEAKKAFETLIGSFPKDPAVPEAKTELTALHRPVVAATASRPAPLPVVTPPPPPAAVRPWAPADIDSKEYPAVQDVPCSDSELVQRTQMKIMRQLDNFERFLATEHIEHQEVDSNGIPGPVREKNFNYLVFVQHPRPGMSFLEEQRDGGENLGSFPTSLATQGLAALAVSVFDPNFEGDLVYKCEGLGTWRGQATWQLHFEQRKGVPSRIRIWKNSRGTFSIPLKGRVWIAANSYDVLHIETDLREPVTELELARDHLSIDYGPVKFERGATTLWLPWDAEMFLELHGKRYHHSHTLRNYMLFSVDSSSTVAKPKQTPEQEQH
jgi:tetratricopeptide (TPR) repeat protein